MSNINHSDDDPSLDRLHRILANPTRRALLKVLRETDLMTIDAAADCLAETQQKDPTQIKTILYHHHLPQMADAQVINYDPQTGHFSPNDTTETAYDVLKQVS